MSRFAKSPTYRALYALDTACECFGIQIHDATCPAFVEPPAPQAVARCLDCGEEGESVGHMGCQYPGRYSER